MSTRFRILYMIIGGAQFIQKPNRTEALCSGVSLRKTTQRLHQGLTGRCIVVDHITVRAAEIVVSDRS